MSGVSRQKDGVSRCNSFQETIGGEREGGRERAAVPVIVSLLEVESRSRTDGSSYNILSSNLPNEEIV